MRISLLAIAVLLLGLVCATPAHAEARVVNVVQLSPTRTAVFIDSPAMGRQVQVQILHPLGGGSRPNYYLLDGLDPGERESTWTNATDAVNFFANENVNPYSRSAGSPATSRTGSTPTHISAPTNGKRS